ncbi:MAG: fasciclin domain-containing protein [Planctomycetota bacterium]
MIRTTLTALVATSTLALVSPALACPGCGCAVKPATKASDHSHDEKSIVDTAAAAGKFNTLLAAAQAAGLAETLAEGGPFTVLAPTDEAFAALGEDAIASLLEPDAKDKLKSILLYHVIDGAVKAETVVTLDEATTLQGAAVEIAVSDDGVTINGANVVKTDVMASNGVIHVIDAVLLPPAPETASAEQADDAG